LHLTKAQVVGLMEAVAHAKKFDLAFNRHWTVHYERAGIADQDGARFVGHLLRLVAAYARRHHGKFAAMWVRENGEGKGGHVHILMHLSDGLTLRNRYRGWIGAAGGNYRRNVSKTRSIGGRLDLKERGDLGVAHYGANLAAVVAYVLKGADAGLGAALDLYRAGEGGRIIGKRCGWTQNLGTAARGRVAPAK
jgi:hypothetical protein